jgi:hypothetical protein
MKKINIAIFLLVVFVLIFFAIKSTSENSGMISVNSFPQKASVYLNGELKGETPLVIKSLPFGKYQVTVKLQGYKDYNEEVSLNSSNSKVFINPILEHSVFSVSIDSDPQGADVYIDGIQKGKTPIIITDLVTGTTHLIELKLVNFKDWKQTVSSETNNMLTINAKLEPITTEVIINSIPSNATVYLNDAEVGKTPLDLKDIAEGTYNLRVTVPQYEPYQEQIEVKKGNTIKRDIVLTKAKYYISISSNPSNAKVFIDGMEVGFTPYESTSITEGRHKIHLELDGYLPYETEVTISQNQPTIISINLLKLP